MNVAVIGLGSMGKRRIRLIKQYDGKINIIGIDTNEKRRSAAEGEMKIKTCESISEAVEKYGVQSVFVSTSPLSHAAIIRQCLEAGLNVFTELNLVDDGYDENIKLAHDKKLLLFLSSTFLYRAEVSYVTNAVKSCESPLCYNYHIGQYLPDWHPWENYRDFFVADKRTNGCREIFAIELPWLINAFGDIKSVKYCSGNLTELDIDYNDNYLVMLEHESGHRGILCVDVASRKAVRRFEVYGETLYMTWDGTPDGLIDYDFVNKKDNKISLYEKIDKMGGYSENIIENAYYDEVACFFETLNGKASPRHSFEKDKKVISVINELEGEVKK